MARIKATTLLKDEIIAPYEIRMRPECYEVIRITEMNNEKFVGSSNTLGGCVAIIARQKMASDISVMTLGAFIGKYQSLIDKIRSVLKIEGEVEHDKEYLSLKGEVNNLKIQIQTLEAKLKKKKIV